MTVFCFFLHEFFQKKNHDPLWGTSSSRSALPDIWFLLYICLWMHCYSSRLVQETSSWALQETAVMTHEGTSSGSDLGSFIYLFIFIPNSRACIFYITRLCSFNCGKPKLQLWLKLDWLRFIVLVCMFSVNMTLVMWKISIIFSALVLWLFFLSKLTIGKMKSVVMS